MRGRSPHILRTAAQAPPGGVRTAYPKSWIERSIYDMLTLQAILLTSSLLLVSGMVASLMWLAALRVRADQDAVPVEALEAHLDSPA